MSIIQYENVPRCQVCSPYSQCNLGLGVSIARGVLAGFEVEVPPDQEAWILKRQFASDYHNPRWMILHSLWNFMTLMPDK